jgi:hypothetical protein
MDALDWMAINTCVIGNMPQIADDCTGKICQEQPNQPAWLNQAAPQKRADEPDGMEKVGIHLCMLLENFRASVSLDEYQ